LPLFLVVAMLLGAFALGAEQDPSPLLNPDDAAFRESAPARFHAHLTTNKGLILLDVQRSLAPHGVDRFYNLVRHGFYDQARFFRVRAGQFAQFGIHGDPQIAERWRTRTIPDDPRRASNVRGAVAFAFAVPNGRATQLFINLRDNSQEYDAEPFVPFAHVIDGMDVADRLYAEYGETPAGGIRAGKQDALFSGGNVFLSREFPLLDYITRAEVKAW
jgi:peptidyl-prolyl cis-trans isomerase A (cyclophilin A)